MAHHLVWYTTVDEKESPRDRHRMTDFDRQCAKKQIGKK